jgi:hypothetical protein
MTIRDLISAWWRKTVAAVVGAVLAYLAARWRWLGLDPETSVGVVAAATAFAISAYGGLVNALERKWPKLGWLLGLAVQPNYRERKTGGQDHDPVRRAGDYQH